MCLINYRVHLPLYVEKNLSRARHLVPTWHSLKLRNCAIYTEVKPFVARITFCFIRAIKMGRLFLAPLQNPKLANILLMLQPIADG